MEAVLNVGEKELEYTNAILESLSRTNPRRIFYKVLLLLHQKFSFVSRAIVYHTPTSSMKRESHVQGLVQH